MPIAGGLGSTVRGSRKTRLLTHTASANTMRKILRGIPGPFHSQWRMWLLRTGVGRENNCDTAPTGIHLLNGATVQQCLRNLAPFLIEGRLADGLAGAAIPIAGVRDVTFLAVQIGMDPRARNALI